MKKNYFFAIVCIVSAFFFFSCIITPQPRESSPNSGTPELGVPNSGIPELGVPNSGVPEFSTSNSGEPEYVAPNSGEPEYIPTAVNPVASVPAVSPPGTIPQARQPEAIQHEVPPEEAPLVAVVSVQPVIEPERSAIILPPTGLGRAPVPENIMGKGIVPEKEMAAFLLASNPGVETAYIEELASIYTEESTVEGVNSDVAFAQMCLETGFLRFGGLVTADMYNFCGLGAIGPTERGLIFPNPRIGVRAHIQHLKAYASEDPLKQLLVDPRFHYVRRGSSPGIDGLAGTWAEDRAYAEKINSILERLYSFYYKY